MKPVQPARPAIDARTAPLHLIVNPRAGGRRGGPDELTRQLTEALPPGTRRWHVHPPRSPAELPALAARVVARARSDGGVIVAAGGDGTLNTVVQALW